MLKGTLMMNAVVKMRVGIGKMLPSPVIPRFYCTVLTLSQNLQPTSSLLNQPHTSPFNKSPIDPAHSGMTTTINDIVDRPYMLNDIAVQAQRLSAALPPDDWDQETLTPRLEPQPSGVFNLVSGSTLDDDAKRTRLTINLPQPRRSHETNAEDVTRANDKRPGWLARICRWRCWCTSRRRNESYESANLSR
jgi:hypothetical protein